MLLDAISAYLPSPFEKANEALDTSANEAKVVVSCASKAPLIALAFKLEQGPFGQLTCVPSPATVTECLFAKVTECLFAIVTECLFAIVTKCLFYSERAGRYMRVYQGTLKRGDFVTFGGQRTKLKAPTPSLNTTFPF